MITAAHIKDLRGTQGDYRSTRKLIARLRKLQAKRKPFYVDARDFEAIVRWKLGNQYDRGQKLRSANTSEIIEAVTRAAFSVPKCGREYRIELQVGMLTTLRGVGIPVASAVLALALPKRYAVLDSRVWRQLFASASPAESIRDYKNYLAKLRPLAKELGWTLQEVDHAIWQYDVNAGGAVPTH